MIANCVDCDTKTHVDPISGRCLVCLIAASKADKRKQAEELAADFKLSQAGDKPE